jgi:hypothetical protein
MSLIEVKKTYGGYTRYGVSHRSRRNTIGIEIEYDGPSSCDADETKIEAHRILLEYGIEHVIEYDGSLNNGAEIVVHPITLEHLKMFSGPAFIQLFDLLRLRGWTNASGRAGGHMTVGRRSFGRSKQEQDANLYRLHRFMATNQDAFQAFGRRPESRYAVWVGSRQRYNEIDGVITLDRRACGKFEAIQYRENTVQFRFFSAHVSFDQLLARYELIQILISTFSGDVPLNVDNLTLSELMERNRRAKPNAYREYIATKDR